LKQAYEAQNLSGIQFVSLSASKQNWIPDKFSFAPEALGYILQGQEWRERKFSGMTAAYIRTCVDT